jgi:hypothetical protein
MNRDSKYLGFILFLWIAAISTAFPDGQPLPSNPSPTANLSSNTVLTGKQVNDAARKQEAEGIYSLLTQWASTPISFYGKVVDGQGKPIEGATIVATPYNAEEHPVKIHKITDSRGSFSVSGVHGAELRVTVSKSGYYPPAEQNGPFIPFGYVNGAGYSPRDDPKNPAIFVLKKRGDPEPLVKLNHIRIVAPKDGTPVFFNLLNGQKTTGSDSIQIQTWVNDAVVPRNGYHPFPWKVIVSAGDGGFLPRTGDAYDFTAPKSGYTNQIVIDMQPTDPKWSAWLTKDYWIRFGDGKYARASIDFRVSTLNITSYLNPQPVHTNLEYNPDQKSP